MDMYWLSDRTAPFATFLTIAQTYLHPESRDDDGASLQRRAQADLPDDPEIRTFRAELVRLLSGDREGLQPWAIEFATDYEDQDTDDEFLEWLWQTLYPNEPVPGRVD
jgi:hypothetical protein